MPERIIYTVSEITSQLKQLLELNFSSVWLEGEISNFKHHSSGHMYFSLKDVDAEINAMMWRGLNRSLRFHPEDGMKVIAYGSLTIYPPRGQYQIVVRQLQPAGVGELQVAFEQLKEKLQQEGLFAEDRKRSLPDYPLNIGIVTSGTGAAFQDMLNVLHRRAPYISVVLAPARVQGEGAAREIVQGIERLNRLEHLDVIIIGRGGGSLEDLWPFNEEEVARAIVASHIPIVSAVGHEVDFSISDFCADYRAPTPSAAAEIVARDTQELMAEIAATRKELQGKLRIRIDQLKSKIERIESHYAFKLPAQKLQTMVQRLDELYNRIEQAILLKLRENRQKLRGYQRQLKLLKPERILQRGFSITENKEGQIINSIDQLNIGDELFTHYGEGYSMSKVTKLGVKDDQGK